MPATLHQLLAKYYDSLNVKPGMVAIAKMQVAPFTYWFGKAGVIKKRTALEQSFRTQIPPGTALYDWKPWNCAEVHAANKALLSLGTGFGNIGGLDFLAIDSHGTVRKACVNCQSWINRI